MESRVRLRVEIAFLCNKDLLDDMMNEDIMIYLTYASFLLNYDINNYLLVKL